MAMAADALVLINLPKKRISFGSWKAQFFSLAFPRAAATLALGFAGLWLGWQWALAIALLVQLAGTLALIWGALVEPFRLQLTEYRLATDRLPAGAAPIRMLRSIFRNS